MESLKLVQSNRRLRAVWLGIVVGLAMLFFVLLLCGLQGPAPARADPGILYVDGATGQDTDTCGTTITPCKTISYTLNSRASGGDTIRVAQGVYTENLTVDKQVTLEGGYEPVGWTRNITEYETIIDGSNSRTVRGDWDGEGVWMSDIISDAGKYKMWYAGLNLYRERAGIGYAESVDGISWVKSISNPVLTPGASGEWDAGGVEHPRIIKEGSVYKMWYGGFDEDGTPRIGYATSSDGISWSKYSGNPVLDVGDYGEWDAEGVLGPYVLKEGAGSYKMWYFGRDDNWQWRIGYATSPDGIHWTKHSGNPVLDLGPDGSWDDESLTDPHLIYEDGTYKMWYTGYDGDVWAIGYAISLDGIHWTKDPHNPVLEGDPSDWEDGNVTNPHVLSEGSTYKMWYSAGDWPNKEQGYATSSDGITWQKYAGNPVLTRGTPGFWGQPVVKFVDGSDGSVLDGFTVRNGEAWRGGGIFMTNHASVRIQNNLITHNQASEDGGGIAVDTHSIATITNNRILSNTAVGGGGGVAINYSAATIGHNTIAQNSAQGGGGIAFYGKCSGDVYANTIACNEVGDWGAGGMAIQGGSVVTATNNIVASNMGTVMWWDGDGIAIWDDATQARLVNNTIAYNSAEGIQTADACTVLVRNNIIVGNEGGIHDLDSAAAITIDHNDVWDNGWANYVNVSPGPGDISADPLFVNAAAGDFHLQVGSPCIDAGTPVGAPDHDFEGIPRDAAPDMGAYEWTGFRIYLPVTLKSYSAGHHSYTDSTTSATPSSSPASYIYTGHNPPYATPRSIEIYWPLPSDITSSTVGISTFKFWGKGAYSPVTHLYVNGHDVGAVNVGTEYDWCTISFYTAYLDQGDNNVIEIWTSSGYTYVASDAPEIDDVGQPNKFYIRNNGGTSPDHGPSYGEIYAQLTAEWIEPWVCTPYYEADFDGPECDWPESDTADRRFGCVNGEFQILLKQPYKNGFVVASILPASDFTLAADVRFATNNAGAAGLIFGNMTTYEFYKFLIWPSPGVFGLYKHDGQALISWRSDAAINTYPATNHLKVEREGSTIRLYANDHLLATVDDSSIQTTGIGVYSNSDALANVDTRYDNFVAHPLNCADIAVSLKNFGP